MMERCVLMKEDYVICIETIRYIKKVIEAGLSFLLG